MGNRGGCVENQGGYMGNAENQGRNKGVGMQGIRLEMRGKWGRNKGVGMEIKHKRSGEK